MTGARSNVLTRWVLAFCLSSVGRALASDSTEDDGNVVVNSRGDVFAVIVCSKQVPDKCLLVDPKSGKPRFAGLREADDRFYVVDFDKGKPVGRIARVGAPFGKRFHRRGRGLRL